MTVRYIALLDGAKGAYGVSFPDLPGCVAMGASIDEALYEAAEALRIWIADAEARKQPIPLPTAVETLLGDDEVREQLAAGATLVQAPHIREEGRAVKANLSIDAGVLAAIDAYATDWGITRSAAVERLARAHLAALS
jgi:predicted RNase H-like HicB family nuclease